MKIRNITVDGDSSGADEVSLVADQYDGLTGKAAPGLPNLLQDLTKDKNVCSYLILIEDNFPTMSINDPL
jgi:hypothetical protein